MRFKAIILLILVSTGLTSASADTVLDTGKAYSLSTKGMTVLQGSKEQTDRAVACDQTALADRQPIKGISPTTGLAVDPKARYLPVMVQISNVVGTAKGAAGKTVKAAGIGKAAPWGAQNADIIYESILYQNGQTRFTFLFHDAPALGQSVHAGPVRSARVGSMVLSRAWGGGYVCAGMAGAERSYMSELGLCDRSYVFDLKTDRYHDLKMRIQGVKAPDNFDVDVSGFQAAAAELVAASPRSFRFADESPYEAGYQSANRICIDWGVKEYISGFVYDAETDLYQRFCGDKPGAMWLSYASADDRDAAQMVPMQFRNVIVQRVEAFYLDNNKLLPVTEGVGSGNADIFIGGRYIPGYWLCEGPDSPTVFFDDQGKEVRLSRGKTYIAQLSSMRLLAYAAE